MRVLLPLHGYVRWNGGLDLIRLLTTAIDRVAESGIEVTFAIPVDSAPSRLLHACFRQFRQLRAGNFGKSPAGGRDALLRVALEMIGDRRAIRCRDDATGILAAAETARADMIFPTMIPLGDNGPPRIGYLFDFQHRHLPQLFSRRTCRNRDRQFRRIAEDSTGIIVNSREVARDTVKFLGFPAAKILAMPFAPYALPHWFDTSPEHARSSYGIDGRYLMVCNHFWTHKDHATALRALALVRANAATADLRLVLTGDPVDHRDPRHYLLIQELTRDLGLTNCTHFLGLIPKRDQLALLRGSVALLQPTLFEGGPGGGSVYEAIGLGVPAVVSDIPINLEINQGEIRFFNAGDALDLANKTIDLAIRPCLRPSRQELLYRGDANLQRLGNAICEFLCAMPNGGV